MIVLAPRTGPSTTHHVDRTLVKVLVAKDVVFVSDLAVHLMPLVRLVVLGIANILVPRRFLVVIILDPSARSPT
jgi:hypothetical protein